MSSCHALGLASVLLLFKAWPLSSFYLTVAVCDDFVSVNVIYHELFSRLGLAPWTVFTEEMCVHSSTATT